MHSIFPEELATRPNEKLRQIAVLRLFGHSTTAIAEHLDCAVQRRLQ
jgi:hypothetical protein